MNDLLWHSRILLRCSPPSTSATPGPPKGPQTNAIGCRIISVIWIRGLGVHKCHYYVVEVYICRHTYLPTYLPTHLSMDMTHTVCRGSPNRRYSTPNQRHSTQNHHSIWIRCLGVHQRKYYVVEVYICIHTYLYVHIYIYVYVEVYICIHISMKHSQKWKRKSKKEGCRRRQSRALDEPRRLRLFKGHKSEHSCQ